MTEPEHKTGQAGMFISAQEGATVISEIVGTTFLSLITLFLLFAWLRTQRRHYELIKQLAETKADQDTD